MKKKPKRATDNALLEVGALWTILMAAAVVSAGIGAALVIYALQIS